MHKPYSFKLLLGLVLLPLAGLGGCSVAGADGDDAPVVAPAAAGESPAAPEPIHSAEAEAALADAMTRLSALDSLHFDLAMRLEADMADRKTVNEMSATVTLRGKDEAFVHAESGDDHVEVFSDGETQTVHFFARKVYAEMPAPESRADIIGALSGSLMREASLWLGRFLHDAEDIRTGALGMELLGDETIDGENFQHIQIGYELYDAHVYLDAETPQLRRLVLNLARGLRELNAPPGVSGALVTFDLTDWTANADVPDTRFAFVAPDGVKKWDPNARPAAPGMEMLGEAAPDFTLDLLDGGAMTLSDHKDKSVVLLDFFASWCGPCRMGMPVVSDLAKKYAGDDVVFYAVNIKESPKTAQKFVDALEIEFPVALDSKGVAQRLYQAASIPRTVIIGKDGTVQAIHAGYSPYLARQLKSDLDALLEGKTLAEPE